MDERVLGYRFALDLNYSQRTAALSHVGARRFAFNHMLALVKAILDQRDSERSYGVEAELLTPGLDWSAYGLLKRWNAEKYASAPWWSENSKEAYADGCRRLADGLSNWVGVRSGTRKGKIGFPRFAARRSRQSVTFTTGSIRVNDRRHIVLPRLGRLRTFEDTTRLSTLIEAGQARISRATLSFDRGRWFVSFTVHQLVDHRATKPRWSGAVGIDLGVKNLLVIAGEGGRELARISAPRHLAEAQRRLRALQRKASRQIGPWDPAMNRHQDPSSRWQRTQSRISRKHARVANLREDFLHKTTSRIVNLYENIVIEDLNVSGMTAAGGAHKRGLNRALKDASFATVATMLTYKTRWARGTITRADRFFPSSKTCSRCGTVKTKLLLSERTFRCEECNLEIDRDLNAAINLACYTVGTPARVPGLDTSGATRKTDLASAGGEEAGEPVSAGAPPRKRRLH